MITVTVTEKGYCTHPATKRLDLDHPDIRHDLEHPARPRSLPGQLLVALAERHARGTGPVTVLSLDNMPSNGHTLRGTVIDLAAATHPELLGWIDDQVRFPCSMVDRMAPATDEAFRSAIGSLTGVHDAWPVKCEPFRQWVVEREWATPMPPLDSVGVTVVDDVAPWEHTKLRVLNGMHTAAALFGLRHGLDTVDAVARDANGARLLQRLVAEITEVLDPPSGLDLPGYVATTLGRFANSGLHHRCAQIATDTSQKLPQRLLGTLAERMQRNLPVDALVEVLALWAWSTLGRDHRGTPRPVDDPLAAEFAAIADDARGDAATLATRLLLLAPVFGESAGDERLAALVTPRLANLL
jgi:fructuronate reductase